MTAVLVITLAAACAALMARATARQELVARACHEVRGPLTAAHLALEAMQRRDEIAPGPAASLEAQLRRARLALADLEVAPRGRRAPDRLDAVPVSGFLAQLALAWGPVAAARGRELNVDCNAAGAALLADRERLGQAAGNLVANALEHGAGPVSVRARASGARVRLEVRDAGAGLPAPVGELMRRRRGARGRGLAIAAGIAERYGGRLTTAPSAVVLDLPLEGSR